MAGEFPSQFIGGAEKVVQNNDRHSQSEATANAEKLRSSVFALDRDMQLRQGSVTAYHGSFSFGVQARELQEESKRSHVV
jgi:hypothetical protein